MLASVVGARQEHTSLLITASAAGTSARMVATFMLAFEMVLEMMYMYGEPQDNVQRAMASAADYKCVHCGEICQDQHVAPMRLKWGTGL
jgi:hypothetical protein